MSRKVYFAEEADTQPFASLLTKRERYYSNPGSREANDYKIIIDDRGHKKLVCVGTHDIYQEIQSYAEECKIENIIARASAGDTAALNARQGFYADITNTPKDLKEAQDSILKLSNEFYKLPVEIREKFDNSMEKFVQTFGTEEWAENMGFKKETAEAPKADKVEFVPGAEEAAKPLTPTEGSKAE